MSTIMSSSQAFVVPSALTTRIHASVVTTKRKCSFTPKTLSYSKPCDTRVRMQEGYKIEQSEYVDPETDDDAGDGFVGESEMDDHLGVSMPDDLAGFEKREIMDSKNRDELVSKLRDIRDRRKDIMVDRRKGIGMENANDYLRNL